MISLTDSQIKNLAGSNAVYFRGHTYYTENRVRNLRVDTEETTILATVHGVRSYDVEVIFYKRGGIDGYWCDCPAASSYAGACKHVVAVLIALQHRRHTTKPFPGVCNKEMAGEIINVFRGLDKPLKKEVVKFEVLLEVAKFGNGRPAAAEFKIGIDKLYVLKNIKEFLAAVKENKSVEFGKHFLFEPEKHTFSLSDRSVIDVLLEMRALEMAIDSYSYYSGNSSFQGKTVMLNDFYLKKFLDALGDKLFSFCYLPGLRVEATNIHHGLPLSFSLEPSGQGVALTLESQEIPEAITDEGDYFYFHNTIFRAFEEQKRYLFPFLAKYMGPNNKIIFPAEYVEPFVSEVMPYIKKAGLLNIAPALEKNLCQEKLIAKVFFDRMRSDSAESQGITARLELHYGEQIINPFSSDRINSESEAAKRIIVRDNAAEYKIFSLLEQTGFTVCSGEIHLNDDEQIFNLIRNILPQLQEVAEIYYSEHFKGLQIRNTTSFSGNLRLNTNLNMLEFSMQFEDIDNDELARVFNSLRLKNKYFRLKDGSFLNLQQPALGTIAAMMEHLGLEVDELAQRTIHLPQYRALYIDSFLRQKEIDEVGRSGAFNQLIKSVKEPQDLEYEVPQELQSLLRDYQKTGFKWLKTLASYGLGGILADDMGLGKTLQVIAFILSEKRPGQPPSLVIAPTSLLFNWYEEVQKFAPSLKVMVVTGTPGERRKRFKEIAGVDILVTSYPLIRRDVDLYRDIEFASCFLDEAQHIKNPNTLNAKSVQQIRARHYFALTGTPIENSLTELWSIFNFVMPGYLMTHSAFQKKYEIPIVKGENSSSLAEFSRHVQPFVLRRLKKDVLKELPEKIETKVVAEMTKEQGKIYLAFLKQAQGEIVQEIKSAGFEKSRIKILAILTRLRQICCHPGLFLRDYKGESGKMLLLHEVLEDVLASGHRILLFSQFTSMLEIIRQYLKDKKISCLYLDGQTKADQRQQLVQTFNTGNDKVFLISLKAGGTGLNLTGADVVIHIDPWWNPSVEEQAADRAHRIGQKNVVQVFKLITRGTIEEKIFALQQKKKDLINAVIKPGETFISKMSEQDLKAIFDIT